MVRRVCPQGRYLLLHSYNQLEEDFSSLREYNDYLEEVETIGNHAAL